MDNSAPVEDRVMGPYEAALFARDIARVNLANVGNPDPYYPGGYLCHRGSWFGVLEDGTIEAVAVLQDEILEIRA